MMYNSRRLGRKDKRKDIFSRCVLQRSQNTQIDIRLHMIERKYQHNKEKYNLYKIIFTFHASRVLIILVIVKGGGRTL